MTNQNVILTIQISRKDALTVTIDNWNGHKALLKI